MCDNATIRRTLAAELQRYRIGDCMILTIPQSPPPELNPNARIHHMKKAKIIREYRSLAWAAALEQRNGDCPIEGPIRLSVQINWPRKARRKDLDNALSSCKAAFDGLTDAGIWRDDWQLTSIEVSQAMWRDQCETIRNQYPAGHVVLKIEQV